MNSARLLVAFTMMLLPASLSAYSITTLDWVSAGNNPQGYYYVSPYTAQVKGSPQQLTLYCIDFNHEVAPPLEWNAVIEPLAFSNFSNFQYASLGTPASTWDKYQAAAWLITQLSNVAGSTSQAQYQRAVFQYAAWKIFVDPAHIGAFSGSQSAVGGAAFANQVTTAYNNAFAAVQGGYTATGWQIVSPYPAGNIDSVQEFLTPGPPALTPAPEPGSILLLSSVVGGLTLILKWRKDRHT